MLSIYEFHKNLHSEGGAYLITFWMKERHVNFLQGYSYLWNYFLTMDECYTV